MWDEETSGPLVGAANTRSHFASLIISPSLRSARSLTSIVYSSQNGRTMSVFRNVLPLTLLPVGSGISRPLFILGYLLGSRGD